MGNLLKFFIVLGIAFIFIGYGTDKLLQTFTGVTYLQGDTIDNDVVSLRTGITVIEYDNHLLVKQSPDYIRLFTAFSYIDDKVSSGLILAFLSKFLEIDINSVNTFGFMKILLITLVVPVLIGAIFIWVLKLIGKKVFKSWFFVTISFSLLALFFVTFKPIIDNLATGRMLFAYNPAASDATMEILQSAIDQKTENREREFSLLSTIFLDKQAQDEIPIYLGDQLKAIDSSPNNATPPDLVNIYQSEQYHKADKLEKKKLEKEQIKQNANEIRKLIFGIYAGVDMGEGNSNTEFSVYSQELVHLHYNRDGG